MFEGCKNLTILKIRNFDTSSVVTMNNMFTNCQRLTSLNLSNFDTSKVISMNNIFQNCKELNSLDLSKFDTSNVIYMNSLFSGCTQISSINLSSFNTSKVNNMFSMFKGCNNLETIDLTSFDTSNVTNMSYMFSNCKNLNSLNLSNFVTNKLKSISYMFENCYKLKSLDLSNFNTSIVTNMEVAFSGCNSLESLDISSFSTSSVIEMSRMFENCKALKNLNVHNFDTSNVISMNEMFQNCENITTLNLSSFDTSNVTYMNKIFEGCKNLTELNLSNFNTSNVKNFENMFSKCEKLVSLNLTNFDNSKVSKMNNMFKNCKSLTYLNINNFNFSSVNYQNEMFSGCISLITIELNNYRFSGNNTNLMYCLNLSKPKYNIEAYNCSGYCNNSLYGFEYNDTCYKACPKKTNVLNTNITDYLCKNLNCEKLGKYYNYNQTDCIDEIPDGYFLNDSNYNTIDKCYRDCKTCDKKEFSFNSNCNSCIDTLYLQYFDFGNCTSSCINGYYNDSNNNKICYCPMNKCKECTLESLNKSLCISCNTEKNFYPIHNESSINNNFIDCYNETQIGYFLYNNSFYEKCYKSCKSCSNIGNESNHNCIECLDNYKLIFQNNCIDNCFNDEVFKYEYKKKCYDVCPFGTINFNNSYLCEDLNCSNYYNSNGTECIDEIQEGYYLYNETLKTVQKCHGKCQKCSFKSTQKNLCISCNNNKGYYPLLNDTMNEYPFINCYNYTPFGYYLVNNTYILDKRCDKFEDFISNNSNSNSNLSYFFCPFYYYCDSTNTFFCTKSKECPENYKKLIVNKNKCIEKCSNDLEYRYEYENKCYDYCPNGTTN